MPLLPENRRTWWTLAALATCLLAALTARRLLTRWPDGQLLARGEFHQVAHKGSGQARLYRLRSGILELAIRDFRTGYIANLEVLLIASDDALNNEMVEHSQHAALGKILASASSWNATLPPGLNPYHFRAVTVWCPQYKVNFTTAPLRFVHGNK